MCPPTIGKRAPTISRAAINILTIECQTLFYHNMANYRSVMFNVKGQNIKTLPESVCADFYCPLDGPAESL